MVQIKAKASSMGSPYAAMLKNFRGFMPSKSEQPVLLDLESPTFLLILIGKLGNDCCRTAS
jgi:hypothetical protein